jgi:hypothetical protein
VRIRVGLEKGMRLRYPRLDVLPEPTPDTSGHFVTMGVGPDLMAAARDARDDRSPHGGVRPVTGAKLLCLCSVAVRLRISEMHGRAKLGRLGVPAEVDLRATALNVSGWRGSPLWVPSDHEVASGAFRARCCRPVCAWELTRSHHPIVLRAAICTQAHDRECQPLGLRWSRLEDEPLSGIERQHQRLSSEVTISAQSARPKARRLRHPELLGDARAIPSTRLHVRNHRDHLALERAPELVRESRATSFWILREALDGRARQGRAGSSIAQ